MGARNRAGTGYRTGLPGDIGWRNSFLEIDSWALKTFKNTGSVYSTHEYRVLYVTQYRKNLEVATYWCRLYSNCFTCLQKTGRIARSYLPVLFFFRSLLVVAWPLEMLEQWRHQCVVLLKLLILRLALSANNSFISLWIQLLHIL
jgi:hypothetical protein